jgi:hypothetical protein
MAADRKTCDQCTGTEKELHLFVDHLRKARVPQGVHIIIKEAVCKIAKCS